MKRVMKTYKIYCLKDPVTLEIRYIGVTTKEKLSMRLSQHWWNAMRGSQTHVAKWIRKINTKPIIELIEVCDEVYWQEREIYWIGFYDNLTNISKGGIGVFVDRNKTSIQRSAEAHAKKIVQLDDEGNLIKVWDSIKEAIKSFTDGKGDGTISHVLRNKAVRAFGYQWFYYDDYMSGNYTIRTNKSSVNYDKLVKVYVYDLDFNLIGEYKCKFEASKALKCSNMGVSGAVDRDTPYLGKYYITTTPKHN